MSDSLQPHGQQHTRLPRPSPSPEVCSNSRPWIEDAIQPSHPLLSPFSPFSLPQHQGFFQWVGSSHQVPKYWNFSFGISPSNEYSVLISFRIGCFDLFAVQGTLIEIKLIDFQLRIEENLFNEGAGEHCTRNTELNWGGGDSSEFPRKKKEWRLSFRAKYNRYFKRIALFEEPVCISIKETPTYIAMLNNNAVFQKPEGE